MKKVPEEKIEKLDCYEPTIFVDKISEELLCPINLGVLNNPISCPLCGVCFCKGCLLTWLNLKKNCPNCRKPVLEKNLQGVILPLKRQVLSLKTGCRSPGCEWKGELEKFELHIGKYCEFTMEKCPQCMSEVLKKDLNQHISNLCSWTIAPCPHCQANMQKRDLNSHYEICPDVEINCNYCKKKLKQREMLKHISEFCEERLSNCIFGCGIKGAKVRQLAKHYFSEHEVEFVNKLDQISRIQAENDSMRQKIEGLELGDNTEKKKGASSENAKKASGLRVYSEDLHPKTFFSTESFVWMKKNLIDDRKFTLEQIHYQSAPDLNIKLFHDQCDNVTFPTIFCVKTEGGQIIGAYTNLSWSPNAVDSTKDPSVILFSATNKRKFISRGDTNIIRSSNQGPSIKDAIHIFDKSKTNICFLGKSLENMFNMGDYTGKEESIIGKPNKEIKNYYIFQISHLFVFALREI